MKASEYFKPHLSMRSKTIMFILPSHADRPAMCKLTNMCTPKNLIWSKTSLYIWCSLCCNSSRESGHDHRLQFFKLCCCRSNHCLGILNYFFRPSSANFGQLWDLTCHLTGGLDNWSPGTKKGWKSPMHSTQKIIGAKMCYTWRQFS